jgi:TRAP-type C4-dicarboxylate transport system permease small subunit
MRFAQLNITNGRIGMGKVLAIFGGLIALVGGVLLLIHWWQFFLWLCRGIVPPALIFGGLIAIIAGISSMKDAARTKKLEEEAKEEEKKKKK